jgi:hypothetical protein
MGCIISKPKIFDTQYFIYNTNFNKQSLTYQVSKYKEENYLISFDIDNLTYNNNLKIIQNEFMKYCFVLTDYKNILQKIMKILRFYITQKDIKIQYIDYLYFHNNLHGNILQITNISAFMNRINDNVKSIKSYFLKCNLDDI